MLFNPLDRPFSWLDLAPAVLGLGLAVGWALHVLLRMNAAPGALNPLVVAEVLRGDLGRARALLKVAPAAPYARMATAVLDVESAHPEEHGRREAMTAAARAALSTARERLELGQSVQAYSVVLLTLTLADAVARWEGLAVAAGLTAAGLLIWRAMPPLLRKMLTASEAATHDLIEAAMRQGVASPDADAEPVAPSSHRGATP